MTKIELLKQCAAQGMTVQEAVKAAGASASYAYSLSAYGVAFARAKRGPKPGAGCIDISRAAQIVAEVEALPPAKLPLYRALRKELHFGHSDAMKITAKLVA